MTGKRKAFARALDRHHVAIKIGPEHGDNAPGKTVRARLGGQIDERAPFAFQMEMHAGSGQGETADLVGNRGGFSPVAAQEFQPRRNRMEEIAHLHGGAGVAGGRLDRADRAAAHADGQGMGGTGRAGGDPQPRHRTDRGERLAAKAERSDGDEIVLVVELGGRMALHGEGKVVRGDPGTVIGNADQRLAAGRQGYGNAPGAGIERVLDKLLHRRSGPFNDLAGGNAADDVIRQGADRHERLLPETRSCWRIRHPASGGGVQPSPELPTITTVGVAP